MEWYLGTPQISQCWNYLHEMWWGTAASEAGYRRNLMDTSGDEGSILQSKVPWLHVCTLNSLRRLPDLFVQPITLSLCHFTLGGRLRYGETLGVRGRPPNNFLWLQNMEEQRLTCDESSLTSSAISLWLYSNIEDIEGWVWLSIEPV